MRSKLFLWFSLGLSALIFACKQPIPPKPNVIVIMADDLGYETISANGGTSYQTPVIDAMAAGGIRFEHAYAQPLCTPSRAQIMTGIYNVRNYVKFGRLEKNQRTFGNLFQEAGYATAVIGKWQLSLDHKLLPQHFGFDEHCLWQLFPGRMDSTGRDTRFSAPFLYTNGSPKRYGKNEFGPNIVRNYGLDFIEQNAKAQKPFFLYYPMILTHCPFSPTPDSPEWVADDTTVMKYKGNAHYFEDMMAYTDDIVGSFLSKLKELGIEKNTLVIFTGDNGTDVPVVSTLGNREVAGAKGKSTDAGTRVPFIASWPGVIPPGQVSQDLVDLTDVLPTICEAANIAVPETPVIDGRSILPQLKGETGNPREWIYSWYERGGKTENAKVFARNQRYKLFDSGEFYEVPNDYLEQNPLVIEDLDSEQKAIHAMLKEVLDGYAKRRFEDVEEQP